MLMRQVIYLLVFNRFYTPTYLQNTQNVGLNETYSLLSSTVTGQINSWLNKLTDIFTMGFNFRTDGEGETASQEYEANFQIHPINQLVINGNFGYRYNDLSNRPFFGDLDIEYLLTPNGKFRAKAYTHTVDKYSLRQANTVQGVGLVFKGVMMLDWTKFFSQHGHYVMGENHWEIAAHDRQMRAKGWRAFSAEWLQSGARVQQMLQCIAENKTGDVNMCLAGTFDGGIYLPMALCAQMYWNCQENYAEITKKVSRRPCITVD
jgi:hypothetical protein